MAEYLNIARNDQSLLLQQIKEESGFTWKQICEIMGVCKSMVYFYRGGSCRIPRDKLQKLVSNSGSTIDVNSLTFIRANYSLQNAVIGEMNEDMAEFLGILFGDGCLGNYNYTIAISGDSVADFLYHNLRIKPLFQKLFGLNPKFIFANHSQEMHTLLNSKMVHEHVSSEFSFPVGYKKGRMSIPKQIYQNDVYKSSFLRGLFDTDGGVHRHHKTSIQIQYTSADGVFQKQVQELLVNFGFTARINGWDIQIRGKNEIDRFFNEIKPANPKHLYKYKKFKETGVVPLHREIDYSSLNKGFILST